MKKLLGLWAHALRASAMAIGAYALAQETAGGPALMAVVLGAIAGSIVAQKLAGTRIRLSVLFGGAVLLPLLLWGLAALTTDVAAIARAVGPVTALFLASVLRFGSLSFGAVAMLRVLAARKRSLVALEIAAVAAAIATAFAAHREGNLARPLWLSDWAYRQGIDPAVVLLGVGFVAVGMLATVLLVETKSRRKISALATLFAIAVAVLLLVDAVGTPKPKQGGDVPATTDSNEFHPPPPTIDAGWLYVGDGGPPTEGGAGPADANVDANQDGGGQSPNGDGAADDGGQNDGAGDGGGTPPGDGSADGGGASGGQDGGEDGAASSGDASDDSGGQSGTGDGGSQQPPPNQPPPKPRLTEDPSNSPSNAPVAVVVLEDDYSPPSQAYYFRQEALSQYNGTRLVATGRTDADHDGLSSFPTEETEVLDPPSKNGRTQVRQKIAMLIEHNNPFALEGPVSFLPARNPNPQRFVRFFAARSLAQKAELKTMIGKPLGDPRWSPELLAYYTVGPADPRYKEKALSIVNKLPPARRNDKLTEAVAIKLALDHEFTYSTKAKHDGMADPTADFLFGNKIGYCVHFAHAAVFLWRSVGIPARIGVGYHSDEENRHGGSTLVIRGSDAHAWPEIYVKDYGWIVLDIAAEKNLDPPQQPVDDELSKQLGDEARNTPPEQDDPKKKEQQAPDIPWKKLFLWGLAILVSATIVLLYLTKIWRRLVPSLSSGRGLPIVAYRAALDVLSENGIRREFGETREQFAARVGETAPSFTKLTDMHLAARLRDPARDPRTAPEFQTAALRGALAAMRREVTTKVGFFKRFARRWKPASFLFSR